MTSITSIFHYSDLSRGLLLITKEAGKHSLAVPIRKSYRNRMDSMNSEKTLPQLVTLFYQDGNLS